MKNDEHDLSVSRSRETNEPPRERRDPANESKGSFLVVGKLTDTAAER